MATDAARELFSRDTRPEAIAPGPPLAVYVQDALRGLKFGQVTITVQDGIVVQIERLERARIRCRSE